MFCTFWSGVVAVEAVLMAMGTIWMKGRMGRD